MAVGTVPVTLAPGMDVNPDPDPVNDDPVTVPVTDTDEPVITPPTTLELVTVPVTLTVAPL